MVVKDKRVLVVGLARSGFAVACALAARGALVTVIDRKPPAEFSDLLPQLMKDKIGLELGSQRQETFLRQEMIVISPGVPWDLPQLRAARERKIPVYPEVEAATWFLQGTVVGITGSNGKTTTTTLLGDMLKASGLPTFVGGNIGNALSSAVEEAKPGTRFVTELSSFQLEGIHEFRPHVAVMLNLSPNHLDRHPSLEAYAQAKQQIFRNQGAEDYAVLNADDPWVAGLAENVASQPILFSRRRELPSGVFAAGGKVYYRVRHLERVLFETRDVSLRGDFNLEDVLAATSAACVLGADFTAIRKAVREFKAVEHRLEFAGEIQAVEFFNNSKATSVDATLKSLEAFERGVHLIMGGKDKGAPYTPLIPLIKERVREVLLIGAAAPVITGQLAGTVELVQAGDLATAVYQAFAHSRPGDTVLLAPACSSFDQFKDYEERGRVFKELVKQLAKEVAAGVFRDSRLATRDSQLGTRDSQLATSDSQLATRDSQLGTRDSQLATSDSQLATRDSQLGTRDSQLATSDSQSVNHEALDEARETARTMLGKTQKPGSAAEASESQSTNSKSRVTNPESRVTSRESRPAEHVGLRYVYEVDAVEHAEVEPHLAPEEEPAIPISEGTAETLDDDALPFEARTAKGSPKSEVRGPKPETASPGSGVRSPEFKTASPGSKDPSPKSKGHGSKSGDEKTESDAPPDSRQPRLPGVE